MPAQKNTLHIGKEEFKAIEVKKKPEFITGEGNIYNRINEWLIAKSKVKAKVKVAFFRLLATMLNSGVSLVKALKILEEDTDDLKMKKICKNLAQSVELGQSLSYSMEDFTDVFSDSQIGMIRSGEATGKLNQVFLQIADQVEKSAKISGKIKGAMTYPIAIFVILVLVTIAILVYVMPGLTEMFISAGKELPFATRVLMSMSQFLTSSSLGFPNWILFLLSLVFVYFLFNFWKNSASGKYLWHRFNLVIPVFGNLTRKVVLAKFARGLSSLVLSGVSIVKAIRITSDLVGNEYYKRRIMKIADDVQQGITIADNIRSDKKAFPIMLSSMIEVGEKTAQLGEICEKTAEFYEDEVDNIVKNLSSLMEPMIIIIIGGVVGFLVIAIMSPIMSMSETISG